MRVSRSLFQGGYFLFNCTRDYVSTWAAVFVRVPPAFAYLIVLNNMIMRLLTAFSGCQHGLW